MAPRPAALRGKTRPRRLRRIDRYLRHAYPPLRSLAGGAPLVVDVGVGAHPDTTLELAEHLAPILPGMRIWGVDVDPDRVAAAQRRRTHRVHFQQADLLPPGLTPHLIRALNLLRGFTRHEAAGARRTLAHALAPGGLLVEGTSDKHGTVAAFTLERRGPEGLLLDRLVLTIDPVVGFAPLMVRPRLPHRLRGTPGHRPLDPLLHAWTEAWRATRSGRATRSEARRQWFVRAAHHLTEGPSIAGWHPLQDPWSWAHGYLAFEAQRPAKPEPSPLGDEGPLLDR